MDWSYDNYNSRKRRKGGQGGRDSQRRSQAQTRKNQQAGWMQKAPPIPMNFRQTGFLGVEKKYLDTSLLTTSIQSNGNSAGLMANPGGTGCFNVPLIGSGPQERNGQDITCTSLHIRGVLSVPISTATATPEKSAVVTFMVIWDKQTNGAVSASENIVVNHSTDAKTAALVFNNLEYSKRYQVLKRLTLRVAPQPLAYNGTNLVSQGEEIEFGCDITLPNIVTTFKASTGAITDIVDNSLQCLCVANENTHEPALRYNARLRFYG